MIVAIWLRWVGSVVQRLGKANPCWRAIPRSVRPVARDDHIGIVELGHDPLPFGRVLLHDRPCIGEGQLLVVDARQRYPGVHRQVAAVAGDHVSERVENRAVDALCGCLKLIVSETGAEIDEVDGRPDVMRESIRER
jgi:hypothetical protein